VLILPEPDRRWGTHRGLQKGVAERRTDRLRVRGGDEDEVDNTLTAGHEGNRVSLRQRTLFSRAYSYIDATFATSTFNFNHHHHHGCRSHFCLRAGILTDSYLSQSIETTQ
jgi:hypothetical protein